MSDTELTDLRLHSTGALEDLVEQLRAASRARLHLSTAEDAEDEGGVRDERIARNDYGT